MKTLTIEAIEQMTHAKYVCTQKLQIKDEVFGDDKKHTLDFHIFDGFAYCPNYKGASYWMDYPKKKFINSAKDMQKTIREYLSMEDDAEIGEKEIMLAYNTLHKNV